jgi:CheY-like chemotaxis protein
MLVIAKDTEGKLLDDLRACRDANPSQRCLYMSLSRAEIPRKELFDHFLKLLHDVPDAYKAQVYICHDQDVFILMQGFMQRHFRDFVKKLSDELKTEELLDMIDIMEVGVHWAKLETICQKKIEALQKEEKKQTAQKKKQATEKATLDVLGRLDPEMVSTVAKRREKRAAPLVMVVDDDQIARTLVGNVIRENYEWSYAKDGQSALTEYVTAAPDVLFLDIGLPDISGHDVLECLFQIDPGAYVIMFSGHKDKDNVMRSLETGAQGFVGKPFTREKLFQYMERSPHLAEKNKRVSSCAQTAH